MRVFAGRMRLRVVADQADPQILRAAHAHAAVQALRQLAWIALRAVAEQGRVRGHFFAEWPRAGARDDQTVGIGHDDGFETAVLACFRQLVVESDERVVTAAGASFEHGRTLRAHNPPGQVYWPAMPKPEMFAARRARVLKKMAAAHPSSVLVLFAAPVQVRNGDVEHDYRQNSDFYWLTGFEEPESIAVLSAKTGTYTLFVRPRDPERETWDGPRAGVEGAKKQYGADAAFATADATKELPLAVADHVRVYHRFGRSSGDDAWIIRCADRARARAREGIVAPTEFVDPTVILHEERLRKQKDELDLMRRACAITAAAHVRVMREAAPGLREADLDASLSEVFARGGAARAAYPSIVGSGPNATVLHHRSGTRQLAKGELLLVDAGCEYGYYASDVTRTIPVSGTFTKEQRALYEAVLEAQLAAIAIVKPGVTLEAVHDRTVEVLVQGLRRLKLLKGSAEKIVKTRSYRQFYMHRTSHWLGMDVHDVGTYFEANQARPLEAGMVFTIEPGLYVAKDDKTVGKAWRGLGVRIEDDILVTKTGFENLTAAIPKTVAEVEAACRP